MIACYEEPNNDVLKALIDEDNLVKAIALWMRQDHRLNDGTPVKPTIQIAKDYLTLYKDFPFKLAITM